MKTVDEQFEEYWETTESTGSPKEDHRGAFKAGYSKGQFDLNNEEGQAANEAAKDVRRKEAVDLVKYEFAVFDGKDVPELLQRVSDHIKKAQG